MVQIYFFFATENSTCHGMTQKLFDYQLAKWTTFLKKANPLLAHSIPNWWEENHSGKKRLLAGDEKRFWALKRRGAPCLSQLQKNLLSQIPDNLSFFKMSIFPKIMGLKFQFFS